MWATSGSDALIPDFLLPDLASTEKKRVEEKQRVARKNRSKSNDEWKTRWFHQGANPHNGGQDWLYSGGYWSRSYSQLPDIY
ncbi:hypothetical protein AMELA_G00059700 [Ameiurus melas]|uniref:Uncharacterized protein n=1 Tax=Ameiurus melas TaxID=219545 RepID=A0A7J6B1J7_AMEME|nr:hypothetical protein AMELA_G00059700 [Ameiurus melas]